jgi:hypothetical protein
MSFQERNQLAMESEQFVVSDLRERGWNVHELGRNQFPDWLNRALTDFRDSYDWPCVLRWQPDLMIVRPDDPQTLRAVDVKRHRGGFDIEQRALLTYQLVENQFHCPVKIVFHAPDMYAPDDLLAISAGKALLSSIPRHGNPEFGSGTPFYFVDRNQMSPMERFFGPKRSTK